MKRQLLAVTCLLGFLTLQALGFCPPQETTAPQESTIVGIPEVIQAGEVISFTLKLDKAPNFDGGGILFSVGNTQTSCSVNTGQKECGVSWRIPATAPRGKLTVHIISFYTGVEYLPIKASDVSFEVLPNANLVFPTAAEIKINPSQVQLFRSAAIALQLQVQGFKAALLQYSLDSPATLDGVIRRNVDEALKSLKKTQLAFRELGGASATGDNERIFFDDLRLSYDQALKGLSKYQKKVSQLNKRAVASGSVLDVAQTKAPQSTYPIIGQAALRPFEQNEAAYKLAADTQSLTFDLTVNSNPEGASVCYHRGGDPCHQNPDVTNTVLKSLPLAIWVVRFDKSGYKAEQREHDPFREPNHVITVNLKP